MAERIHPNVVVHRNVVNQSERAPVGIRAVVLHSTEGPNRVGIADLVGLGNFFNNPAVQASSHVGVDQDGNSAIFVPGARKAWTQAAYNSACLSIECIGFATENWTAESKRKQRREVARWLAVWSLAHGIPLRKGAASNGSITRKGVLQHRDLGAAGGGHHDISADYPLRAVLMRASFYKARMRARHLLGR